MPTQCININNKDGETIEIGRKNGEGERGGEDRKGEYLARV